MSELNAKARALIRTTQFVDEPSEADYDRVHAAVEARIALGIVAGAAVTVAAESAAASTAVGATATVAAATTAATGTATATAVGVGLPAGALGAAVSPAATTLGAALFTKVAAWVVVVGAVAAGTTAVARHEAGVRAEAVQVSVLPARTSPAPTVPAEVPRGVAAPTPPSVDVPALVDLPPPVAVDTTPRAATVEPNAAGRTRGGPSTAPLLAPADTSSLDSEVALLRDAREALRGGQPDRALAVVVEHARRYPRGALAEERDAERILCLCALGRVDEARARTALFVADHPQSSYQASLKSSCAAAEAHP